MIYLRSGVPKHLCHLVLRQRQLVGGAPKVIGQHDGICWVGHGGLQRAVQQQVWLPNEELV